MTRNKNLLFLLLSVFLITSKGYAAPKFCENARLDNNVFWHSELGHDSFDLAFRSPFGAVKTDQKTVRIRFTTCKGDVQKVRLRVWNAVEAEESWFKLEKEFAEKKIDLGLVQVWSVELPIPEQPNIFYYLFEITDGSKRDFYVAKDPKTIGGGWGRFSHKWIDDSSYQLTIFDKDFQVAEWMQGALIYQIFPDRFRNAVKENDPSKLGEDFVFGMKKHLHPWDGPFCDPLKVDSGCYRQPDNQYYGGDLQGVIQKLDYLKTLGVDVIYFNPIFQAATSHRYDTQDHFSIDRNLGGDKVFDKLVQESKKRGIRVILDGVYNHISSDSRIFDLYSRWDGEQGACESFSSPYRGWFFLPHRNDSNRARNNTAGRYWEYAFCPNGAPGMHPGNITGASYEAWAGYFELAVLNWDHPGVRNLFYGEGEYSVTGYWLKKGVMAWRMDVAGLLDSGRGSPYNNGVWENVRTVMKEMHPEAVMIGEEWANASSWLLGNEWDTAMNYRFRTTVLNWMFDGCKSPGHGCQNGLVFEDNDFNWSSLGNFQGPLSAITEKEMDLRLRSIQENYPETSWISAMNLVGTHDTSRVLFLLKKSSWDDAHLAKKKLKLLSTFQYTYPGAPTLYYGDEVGISADSVWFEGKWLDDPYNRAPYPWEDEGLAPDKDLLAHYQELGQLRQKHRVFANGKYKTLAADSEQRLFAFLRENTSEKAIVILNRHLTDSAKIEINVGHILPEGTVLKDLLGRDACKVHLEKLSCSRLAPLSAKALVLKK